MAIRICLVLTEKAKKKLYAYKEWEDHLNVFFEYPRLGDPDKKLHLSGSQAKHDFTLEGDYSWYWNCEKEEEILFYKEQILKSLYAFLCELDRSEDPEIRYLFIELGLNRQSVYIRGDYFDNPCNVQLKMQIFPHEKEAR